VIFPQWAPLLRDGRAAPTLILSGGVGLHAIDVFVIAAVMPAVVADLGGAGYYAWSTMLYMVASILGSACGAPAKHAFGARGAYVVAALVFLAGTAGCAASPSMAALLVARTVQGAGGGLLLAQSMSLVREIYPTEIRTRMLAFISAVWAVAALLGPLIGGLFGELGWWRGAFWISTPVILAFVLGARRALPQHKPASQVQAALPVLRLLLLAAGVMAIGLAGNIDAAAAQGALLIGAVLLLAGAFRLDALAADRLFPSRALSATTTTGSAYWLFFLLSITHSAVGVFLPLAIQVMHGVGPLGAAYFNGVLALGWTAASMLVSGWHGRRESVALIGGTLLAAASLAGLAAAATATHPAIVALLAGSLGVGIGMSNIHVAATAMRLAAQGEESVTASSIPTVRSLGVAFGAAAAGLVANAAGLAAGIAPQSVARAIPWVYGAAALAPAAAVPLAVQLDRLRRRADSGQPR
jgi:MFS family permease